MKPLIAWLHLSDIHFGHGTASQGWDQRLVLSCLLKDVTQLCSSEIPSPELVLVTGDIAFSGASRVREGQTESTEYQEASAWLRSLGQLLRIDRARIFTVPGNHDVQRSADRDSRVAQLLTDLREGRVELDSVLADPERRKWLAQRQANYLAWAAEFAPACAGGHPLPPEQRLFWTHRIELAAGLGLRLVGLNTALLSADDADRGRLWLGKQQLDMALFEPPIEPQDLTLILSHHPLHSHWMADEQNADAWIRNHAHLHLFGHVHEADSEHARRGAGGQFVRVVAGAAHGEQLPAGASAGHGYNIAAVFLTEDGQLVLRVWPRRWSDKNKLFVADHENIPQGESFAEHHLRSLTVNPQGQPRAAPRNARPSGAHESPDWVDEQINKLHREFLQALQTPGLDDKELVLLSNTATKLTQLLQSAPQHLDELCQVFVEWENRVSRWLTPDAVPTVQRLFSTHQKSISDAWKQSDSSRGRAAPSARVSSRYAPSHHKLSQHDAGVKLLLSSNEFEQNEGLDWLLSGGFSKAGTRLARIRDPKELKSVFDVLWRRFARIRLYHRECLDALQSYLDWNGQGPWMARMAKVALCESNETRFHDAEAILTEADETDRLVLASCLLTHPKKECRTLANKYLPAEKSWDTLLCEDVPLLFIHEILCRISQDCDKKQECDTEYIKTAFLLLIPRLSAIDAPFDIVHCFDILKLFYTLPVFWEDPFFKELNELYCRVISRAFGNSNTQRLAQQFKESFKDLFAHERSRDPRPGNLWNIPLPIQRQLARDGEFIEHFICSSRDPIAFETVPHVIERADKDALSFFRIPAINVNALNYLAKQDRLNTKYPIKVAFCRHPKAKADMLKQFLPTLSRRDLTAISQDKMASTFAREQASKYVVRR